MNGLYALTIVFVVYALGDMIATKTKTIISMLFVASVVFAIGFWNGLPATIFTDSALQGFASVSVGLLLVHMGTTIKLKNILKEWKTVVIVLCSTVAICLGVYFIGSLFIERIWPDGRAHPRRRCGGLSADARRAGVGRETRSSSSARWCLWCRALSASPSPPSCAKKEALRLKGQDRGQRPCAAQLP